MRSRGGVAQFYRFGGFSMRLVEMVSYVGWLGAWGALVIGIIRVAGYTTVPRWHDPCGPDTVEMMHTKYCAK